MSLRLPASGSNVAVWLNLTVRSLPVVDSGVIVAVTTTGEDSYDLEIQTAIDKKLTKLPGRKFSKADAIAALRSSTATAKKDRRLLQFASSRAGKK